ncbi:hypothetical protein ACHAP5_010316 [Fusarium lateritium]
MPVKPNVSALGPSLAQQQVGPFPLCINNETVQLGPRQQDGHSCGVFMLNAIRCLLNGDTLPVSFNEPVQTLLSLLPIPPTETEIEIEFMPNKSF